MECDALISTVMATPTLVQSAGTIPVGNAVHGYGKAISINGDGIALKKAGYYRVFANATLSPASQDSVTINLNIDGVPVQGATTTTPEVASGDMVNGSLQTVILIPCACAGRRTLTFTITNEATVYNFSVIVEKE